MKRFLSVLLCAVMVLMLLPAITLPASAKSLTHFDIRLDAPIASYTPDFTPTFNTDVYLYYNVTWQENSPGFNMKLNSHDEFKAGLAYKVEIWVWFSDGNCLATNSNGDLDATITVNGHAISSLEINRRNDQNQITEVTITCEYDPLPGSEISQVYITGIPTPVAGNMPGYSFTIDSNAYGFYHTEPIVWMDKTNNFKQLDSSDTFIEGHEYQLCIWLYANREGGFTFKTDQYGNPQVNVILNSWAPDKVNKAYEQDGREVIEILYTFPACPAAHICNPQLVPQQDPTCVMPGFRAYYECSCGNCYEDAAGTKLITDLDGYGIIPAKGHKEGNWGYNGTQHYKKCVNCNEAIPGTEAAHSGGTATCIQKAICDICGYAYGETDPEHKWSPTYLYLVEAGHAWICADCKCHSEIEPHKPGPAATETTPQICTECGYTIAPAIGHIHELIFLPDVAPTCMASGTVAHYACSGCTARFSDAEGKNPLPADTNVIIPPLGHTASDNWGMNAGFHWRTCTTCQEVLIETEMIHDMAEGKCLTCGYSATQNPEPTEPNPTDPKPTDPKPNESKPAPTQPGNQAEKPDASGGWILPVVIAVVCFVVGIVATALIMKKKKQ